MTITSDAPSRHVPVVCPDCGVGDVALTYCGCGRGLGDVYTCQAEGCGAEVEVGWDEDDAS